MLTVIAIIGFLAALLLSAVGAARQRALSFSCVSNLRQLQLGWHMYANDNNDELTPNNSFDSVSEPFYLADPFFGESGQSWCPGIAPVDTNAANVEQGLLYPYSQSARIYHCPADLSTVTNNPGLLRTRSYCMSIGIHCDDASNSFQKLTQIDSPAPSAAFVLIDTQEQDIWDSTFGIFSLDSASAGFWLDLPADRHQQGANLTFADGHAEHWRWKAAKNYTGHWAAAANPGDLADLQRLQRDTKPGLD